MSTTIKVVVSVWWWWSHLEAQHRIDREVGKVLLVLVQELGRQCGLGDVDEVLAELGVVRAVILGEVGETLLGGLGRETPAVDDGLRMDVLLEQLLALAQKLAGEHTHARRAVTDLRVLRLGDICIEGRRTTTTMISRHSPAITRHSPRTDQHFGSWVIDVEALEDGGAVVGDRDLVLVAHRLQDLVLRIRERSRTRSESERARRSLDMAAYDARTMPLGPRVVFSRSVMKMAPTNEDCSTRSEMSIIQVQRHRERERDACLVPCAPYLPSPRPPQPRTIGPVKRS